MRKEVASGTILIFLLTSMLAFAFNTRPAVASGTIYIRVDGSIDPPTALISTNPPYYTLYTFTDNIFNDSIAVERNNIVVDGAGYTLQGTGVEYSAGIDMSGRTNVTVQNTRIIDFHYGIRLRSSSNNNRISGNNIANNDFGIWLAPSSNNIISGNNMTNNDIAIEGRSSSNNNIGGNTIIVHGGGSGGINLLQSCNNNIISGNTIANSSFYGICLWTSSNYNIIRGNSITSNEEGIELYDHCSYNNVSGNTVAFNRLYGIELYDHCSYNNVSGNTIAANTYYGIDIDYYCSDNIFTENNISGWTGFNFEDCSNNSLIGNNVRDITETAIIIDHCSNLTLTLNSIVNATRSFEIWSEGEGSEMLSHYMHNIKASNTIDGKPVYYWTNQRDKTVPAGAGLVALVNCTNVKVHNQSLSQSGTGLLVAFTQNSKIYANKISGCLQTVATRFYGIRLIGSHGNTVFDNELSYNDYGIELTDNSASNTVAGNKINASTYDGISIWYSDENLICGNEIQNSGSNGLNLDSSNSNSIYGNNFISNSPDVRLTGGTHTWDQGYPAGGNHWSDYSGSDDNSDGIGDTPRIVDDFNQDNFPLMNPERMFELPLPFAFFSYRIDYATNNVTFDASGSYGLLGNIVSYSWDFGDGQEGAGVIVSHVYDFSVSQFKTEAFAPQANDAQATYDATLTITDDEGSSNGLQREVGIGNLICENNIGGDAVPMQVFTFEGELVHSKTTHFQIWYNSTFRVPVSASIRLDAPGFRPNSSLVRNVIFDPGANNVTITRVNMVPFEKTGAKIRVILDPENAIGETNETDNTSEFYEYDVNDTKPLEILFVPVRFEDEDGYPGYFAGYSRQLFEEHGSESMKYAKATFPVADNETSYTMSCFNSALNAGERPKTNATANTTLKDLVSKLAARAGGIYDRVVGVVRTNWFDGIPGWTGTLGYMYTTCPTACVVTLGNWKVTAHELGHTFGLDENNAYCEDGYYAAGKRELDATQTWMSTGAIANPPAEETYRVAVPGFWITDTEYEHLVEEMRLPTDPELLFFSATFWKNGTVKPDSWYRYPDGWPTYTEADTGNYSLVQLDSVGNVLSTVGFNVTFENVISEHPDRILSEIDVAFTVPYAAGTKTIQIRNRIGTVVASKSVSDNTPTVSVISPNGGEMLTTDHVQVSWTASDIDGDSLVYNLEVSGDGGATWDPVAAGLTQTTLDLILTGFKGSDKYLVKVIASDGVNTAEDVSNDYFTIASFSVEIVSEPEPVQIGGRAYVLLKVASYGSFSNPVALDVTCSTAHQLGYKWMVTSTISPRVNGYIIAVLEVTFNTTQTGIYTLYLSGSSGTNTEVAAIDFPVELAEVTSDITPPTTNHNYNGLWQTSDFTITLTATDNTGVSETYYRINNGPTQSFSANGQPHITTEGPNNTLEYWSIDNNGNEELPHKTLTGIKLDKTIPTGSITIAQGASYTNSSSIILALSATDATSGVAQMRFSNDNVTWLQWEAYSTSKTWTLTSDDGAKTVYWQIKDNAGLVSSTYSDTIILDATKPTADAGTDQTVNVGTTVPFDASGSTDNVGIVSYEWDFGDEATGTGKTATHEYTQTGTYTVTLTVKDAAGNTVTDTVNITVLSAEAFPMWIAGVAAATIAIAAVVILLLRRRK